LYKKHAMKVMIKKILLVLIFCLTGSVVFAQGDLTGTWDTRKQDTIVKIYEKDGQYFGKIISSDNPEAEIGKQIIKNFKHEDGEWKGKLYAVKQKRWFDAKMEIKDNNLEITISVGFFHKKIVWNKI
jgi:uncharacterized protein (DUF2147 family)